MTKKEAIEILFSDESDEKWVMSFKKYSEFMRTLRKILHRAVYTHEIASSFIGQLREEVNLNGDKNE